MLSFSCRVRSNKKFAPNLARFSYGIFRGPADFKAYQYCEEFLSGRYRCIGKRTQENPKNDYLICGYSSYTPCPMRETNGDSALRNIPVLFNRIRSTQWETLIVCPHRDYNCAISHFGLFDCGRLLGYRPAQGGGQWGPCRLYRHCKPMPE